MALAVVAICQKTAVVVITTACGLSYCYYFAIVAVNLMVALTFAH